MTEFHWLQRPRYGVCPICGASSNDSGFVDFIADVPLRAFGAEGEQVGWADLFVCANCVRSAARLVGCIAPDDVEAFNLREAALMEENEKLKDEIKAHEERFARLVSLTPEEAGIVIPDGNIAADN